MFGWGKKTYGKCSNCGQDIIEFRYERNNCLMCVVCAEEFDSNDLGFASNNWNVLVTPQNFGEFIGQEHIKKELQITLKAAKLHGINVPHTIFSGFFGSGKTTLARIVANELTSDPGFINAEKFDLRKFPQNSVVIVDEIHALKKPELLLSIMDTTHQTILGCTTTLGSLSGPLRSRFVPFILEPYSTTELVSIMDNINYKLLNNDCTTEVLESIAKRSKQVARTSLILLRRLYDRYTVEGSWNLGAWYREMRISAEGLDPNDKLYLASINKNVPAGIKQICTVSGLDENTITESIEPFLVKNGYVQITPRGRIKLKDALE